MKRKIFSALAVVLFISSNLNAEIMQNDTCDDYAWEMSHAEEECYGAMTDDEWYDAYEFYLFACDEAGGPHRILDASFIY